MSEIHVALAADRRCLWGCAASMRSIADGADFVSGLNFHVFANGLRPRDRQALHDTVGGFGKGRSIRLVDFDPTLVRHLLRSKLITRTAYARLFLDRLVPPQVKRCVYVDCDLMFNRDIGELWGTDLEDRCVGAVDNGRWGDSESDQHRLGLAAPEYFNSGVLVIDLERWRSREVGTRALRFAEKVGDRLILHDQDALNGVLQGDWLPLPPYWNKWVAQAPELEEDSAAVFHFMGAPKPWHPDYNGRFAAKFFQCLDRTAYAGCRPWNPLGLGARLSRARRGTPFLPAALRLMRARILRADSHN